MLKSVCLTFVLFAAYNTVMCVGAAAWVCPQQQTTTVNCLTDTTAVLNGGDKKAKVENAIVAPKPDADYQYTVKGLTVLYENNHQAENRETFTYVWELGDGTTTSENTPEYTYPTMGSYRTCLTVLDKTSGKVIDKKCKNVEIIDADLCDINWEPVCGCDNQTYMNACFAENYHGVYYWLPGPCQGIEYNLLCNFVYAASKLTLQFINTSEGNYDSFSWNFGDGKTGEQRNPTHTYSQPGAYKVCLTVGSIVTKKTLTTCEEVVVADNCSTPK